MVPLDVDHHEINGYNAIVTVSTNMQNKSEMMYRIGFRTSIAHY